MTTRVRQGEGGLGRGPHLLLRQLRHLVVSAAQLEGLDRLQVLPLQQDGAAQSLAAERDQRGKSLSGWGLHVDMDFGF